MLGLPSHYECDEQTRRVEYGAAAITIFIVFDGKSGTEEPLLQGRES
jgi:hypothetical protein